MSHEKQIQELLKLFPEASDEELKMAAGKFKPAQGHPAIMALTLYIIQLRSTVAILDNEIERLATDNETLDQELEAAEDAVIGGSE